MELSKGLLPIPDKPGSELAQSYLDEVRRFREELELLKEHPPQYAFPFVNKEQVFFELARTLSFEQRATVLIGDTGVGKTMLLDTLVELMTNEEKRKAFSLVYPEIASVIERSMTKTDMVEKRDYLCLPNLNDPFDVVVIDHANQKKFEQDVKLVKRFCGELTDIVEKYAWSTKPMHFAFDSKEAFTTYLSSSIHEMFVQIYEGLSDVMEKAYHGQDKRTPLLFATLHLPEYGKVKPVVDAVFIKDNDVRIPLKNKALRDVAKYRQKPDSLTALEKNIALKYVYQELSKENLEFLIQTVEDARVNGLSGKEKYALFVDIFNAYTERVVLPLKQAYEDGKIANQSEAYKKIVESTEKKPERERYEKSIATLLEEIHRIGDEHKEKSSLQLQSWIDSVVAGISLERDEIGKYVKQCQKTLEEMSKQGQDEYEKPDLQLRHGRFNIDLKSIMQVNTLRTLGTGELSLGKISHITDQTVFGRFKEHDEKTPPHMTLTRLGTYFSGTIILVKEAFNDFVRAVADPDKGNMRQTFLQYLKTGYLTLSKEDISFRLYAPRFILGGSIEDPFYTVDEIDKRLETELQSKFLIIEVPSFAESTTQTRKGTLSVIDIAVNSFNERNKTDIKVNDQVMDMLLQSSITLRGMLDVRYLNLAKKVEDLCAYGLSKKKKELDEELILDWQRNIWPIGYFASLDLEQEYGGYFDSPIEKPGTINGLFLYDEKGDEARPRNRGTLAKVHSYIVQGISQGAPKERFVLQDMRSKLTEQVTNKSYHLAIDHVLRLLEPLSKERVFDGTKWQVSTQYYQNYERVDGPSAALAYAISIFSAMGQVPVFRNRFVTGTLAGDDGRVEAIGGAYFKSLIPYRLKQLSLQRKEQEPFYFLLPATNVGDFKAESVIDPFHVRDQISIIPIRNFFEAYHLLTCGHSISQEEWQDAEKKGREKVEYSLQRIKSFLGTPKLA
jgi:hypothetical protein